MMKNMNPGGNAEQNFTPPKTKEQSNPQPQYQPKK